MQNKILKVRNQLIRNLSQNPKTISETRDYLRKKGIDSENSEIIIEELIEKKFLNDDIFSRCWIDDRHHRKGYGPYRLKNELRKKGIEEYIIEKGLEEVFSDKDDTEEIIKSLIEKKLPGLQSKEFLMKKKKLYDYLIRQGYSSEMFSDILHNMLGGELD